MDHGDLYSPLASGEDLDPEVFPYLGTVSAAFFFQFVPIPRGAVPTPEFVYVPMPSGGTPRLATLGASINGTRCGKRGICATGCSGLEICRSGCAGSGAMARCGDGLGGALEAFILEHEYCGELGAAVEEDRVWMTCTCGAVIVRTLEAAA